MQHFWLNCLNVRNQILPLVWIVKTVLWMFVSLWLTCHLRQHQHNQKWGYITALIQWKGLIGYGYFDRNRGFTWKKHSLVSWSTQSTFNVVKTSCKSQYRAWQWTIKGELMLKVAWLNVPDVQVWLVFTTVWTQNHFHYCLRVIQNTQWPCAGKWNIVDENHKNWPTVRYKEESVLGQKLAKYFRWPRATVELWVLL